MNLRIKLLRRQLGLSLQSVANTTGLTKSYLSKVERGECVPSIAAALKIAATLKVDVAELFSREVSSDMVAVIRRSERLKIWREGAAEGSRLEAIAVEVGRKRMLPFIVEPSREFADGPHLSGHAGEEFLLVLRGRLEIAFPERTEVLRVGDAIYFNALVPHRLRSVGNNPASAVVVISAEEERGEIQ